ncbi:hypothetical protein PLUTE_a4723 [Pseudoalteromonas luteoviolacea DSM 6061]|nr:hypothetical protein [Pseudoalteromonas luteoviolacea DSM 6061]
MYFASFLNISHLQNLAQYVLVKRCTALCVFVGLALVCSDVHVNVSKEVRV